MPPADLPAAGDVLLVVAAGEQLAQPLDQRALEAVDLLLAAGDDLAGIGMATNLIVEIVDENREMRREQFGGRRHAPRGLLRPAHPGL